jgi:hypothetical protein
VDDPDARSKRSKNATEETRMVGTIDDLSHGKCVYFGETQSNARMSGNPVRD